jgi:general secretion pathway protein L
MANRILGLDVGASRVKAVLLDSTYRGATVLDAAAEEVAPPAADPPEPLRDRQMAALQRLLAARAWQYDSAMVALPGVAATHLVRLPFTDPRRIEQTVGFEVEAQIPFDLAEVSWDWQPLPQAGEGSDLLVGVVRKEELADLLAGLAGAGVDPRAVVPAGPAYAALWAAGALPAAAAPAAAPEGAEPAPAPPDAAEVLVDMGHSRTCICVAVAGACEMARTLAIGAQDPVAAVARELRATLRAWRARRGPRPVSRLWLAGNPARNEGLAELLRPEVEGTVEPLALAGPLAERLPPEVAPGMALALALALRGHQGSRAPRMNLRRGDLAFTRDFEHVRGRVVRLAAYAGLVLLLAAVTSGVKIFALSRQEALLDRALCETTQTLAGKCYDDFDVAVSVLKGKGTAAAVIPRVSAVDIFAELSVREPRDVPVRFDRIEITRDKIHLQGTTDAAENVDKVISALRGSRCFGDARSGGARRRASDQKFEFTIDSDLTCEVGGAPSGGRG